MKQYDIYMLVLGKGLRNRPGMYIGDPSPNSLLIYLHGYQAAMRDAGVIDASKPDFHGFHDWIANKFGFSESTAGWAKMILAVTLGADPEDIIWEEFDRDATTQQRTEATYRCFELIEEFHDTELERKGH